MNEINQIRELIDIVERRENAPKGEEGQQLEYILKRLAILENDLVVALAKPGKQSYKTSVTHARYNIAGIRRDIELWRQGVKPEVLND